ncbi:serine/threonine dehydratase [Umboniibacter marinipuniceus]|uniref:Threonine dehydratase n=1 Tax=Umboniibacter marinipuniceus TaxID=569599 RepID=A0A3M0A2B2_9GAMM|nr:serine/threonine dehydratase [Umboniibacter marinipuniceus]RMA78786.1 threonine dehydratase [Umboniibacter marinipuniceus]
MIDPSEIARAQKRLAGRVKRTPIVSSQLLNRWLGHEFFFKAECLQSVGAFKARGALNMLSKALAEPSHGIERVVANSSGNHAQAVAWAAREAGLPATILMPKTVSAVKAQATRAYGAQVILGEDRLWVDREIQQLAREAGTLWLPPYDHPDIIAGQGTVVAEALEQVENIDVIAAPCGGGGLLAGSLLAAKHAGSNAQVVGAEPLAANDAAQSLRAGEICALTAAPKTVADGAMTLQVGQHNFPFLQQLNGFYEIPERDIVYWYQWLNHLLKLQVEPTSAMTMSAVLQHLKGSTTAKRILIVLSGGNVDAAMRARLWKEDQLSVQPSLEGN